MNIFHVRNYFFIQLMFAVWTYMTYCCFVRWDRNLKPHYEIDNPQIKVAIGMSYALNKAIKCLQHAIVRI